MAGYAFAPACDLPQWPFRPPPELTEPEVRRHPVVIVGAGPAGLTLACDLALRGVPAVLLDEDDTVGVRGASSRGICYAQKSLEIFERLGIYERIADKGITWSVGKTFSGAQEVYGFNLQTESASRQPPFINLQQFYIEWFLVERIMALGVVDLRWKSHVSRVEPHEDGVRVHVDTPAGSYMIDADHLVDASGAHSAIREKLQARGHTARSTDRWCITDVRFKKPLPIERWTWVDAPFNDGRAVWQHMMADNVWRMDYQMPEDCDLAYISRPEVAGERLRRQLGDDVDFEFVWIGPYGYRDFLLDEFRHGRVLFIGDAAHVVSPFGARGGNSGIQDAANLGWKLALVTRELADASLLETYGTERHHAAAENLKVTRRTARFLAPRSAAEHTLRRAALALAARFAFGRTLVNTGRMSVANAYPASSALPEGAHSVQNLPLAWCDGTGTTLMELLAGGTQALALWFTPGLSEVAALRGALAGMPVRLIGVGGKDDIDLPNLQASDALAAQCGGAAAGSLHIVRPDAYLVARLKTPTPAAARAAVCRALHLAAPA